MKPITLAILLMPAADRAAGGECRARSNARSSKRVQYRLDDSDEQASLSHA